MRVVVFLKDARRAAFDPADAGAIQPDGSLVVRHQRWPVGAVAPGAWNWYLVEGEDDAGGPFAVDGGEAPVSSTAGKEPA